MDAGSFRGKGLHLRLKVRAYQAAFIIKRDFSFLENKQNGLVL